MFTFVLGVVITIKLVFLKLIDNLIATHYFKTSSSSSLITVYSCTPPYNFLLLTTEKATSPEMEQGHSTMESKNTLSHIVIDECHCIDIWGFDSRPAYANLGRLPRFKCPLVGMTGACTSRTEREILASLNISDATIVGARICSYPCIFIRIWC